MSFGVLGKKLGMTRVFADDGREFALTVLQVPSHKVLCRKTLEKHGYEAVVVGAQETQESGLTKPMKGFFSALGHGCYKMVKEFRGSSLDALAAGDVYGADCFSKGQFVDVTGTSIGKGFAGGIKRHNFGGLRASHGVSVSHRSHGSTGNREYPGKVFKGKRMAGHLGCCRVTLQNISVYGVDGDLLLVHGGVPGPEGGVVLVQAAVKMGLRQ
ncbi:MAG: 50S ribosomal protein L3 [Holosporaceae bacterium]|jgi:large subunit ribosomal protein L3|nr:50S ribosomal protein L3 [Holosporaceae bacterium]